MSQRKPVEHNAPAIAPLPVLPVFLNLQNRRVLVVGDDAALGWKIELLRAAGAHVHLVSQTPSIFASHTPSVELSNRAWRSDDLDEAAIVIGGFRCADDASALASAARQTGIPVNVVDQPEFCDFQFGSIVNRNPIVVSISTSGAMPVLAQLIRTKIEGLLPRELGKWAAFAKSIRTELKAKLPDLQTRKAFWRNFAKASFVRPFSVAPHLLSKF